MVWVLLITSHNAIGSPRLLERLFRVLTQVVNEELLNFTQLRFLCAEIMNKPGQSRGYHGVEVSVEE